MPDFYVASGGVNGNGSKMSPWAGFSNILWGSIGPGDSLTILSGTYDQQLNIQSSGVMGAPIRIICAPYVVINCRQSFNDGWTTNTGAGAPANISGWVSVGGGLWKKGAGVRPLLFQTDSIRSAPMPTSALGNSEATVIADIQPGEWTAITATMDGLPNTLYWMSPDGNGPAQHVLTAARPDMTSVGGMVRAISRSNLIFEGELFVLGKSGTSFSSAPFYFESCDNVLVTGNLKCDGCSTGVRIVGGSNSIWRMECLNGELSGAGIDSPTPSESIIVEKSVFRGNGNFPRYSGGGIVEYASDCDGLGIGQDGGVVGSMTIRDSVFTDNGPRQSSMTPGWGGNLNRGSGLYFGTGFSFSVGIFQVSGCEFVGNRRYGMHVGGEAIEANIVGNKFIGNLVAPLFPHPVIHCGTPEQPGDSMRAVQGNFFGSNENIGCVRVFGTDAAHYLAIQDNVFNKNGNGPVSYVADIHLSSGQVSFDESRNVFNSDVSGHVIVRMGSTDYTTLSSWQIASGQGVGDVYDQSSAVPDDAIFSNYQWYARDGSDLYGPLPPATPNSESIFHTLDWYNRNGSPLGS